MSLSVCHWHKLLFKEFLKFRIWTSYCECFKAFEVQKNLNFKLYNRLDPAPFKKQLKSFAFNSETYEISEFLISSFFLIISEIDLKDIALNVLELDRTMVSRVSYSLMQSHRQSIVFLWRFKRLKAAWFGNHPTNRFAGSGRMTSDECLGFQDIPLEHSLRATNSVEWFNMQLLARLRVSAKSLARSTPWCSLMIPLSVSPNSPSEFLTISSGLHQSWQAVDSKSLNFRNFETNFLPVVPVRSTFFSNRIRAESAMHSPKFSTKIHFNRSKSSSTSFTIYSNRFESIPIRRATLAELPWKPRAFQG